VKEIKYINFFLIFSYFFYLTVHGQNDRRFMRVLTSLPIWQIHPMEETKFIDTTGKLLTYNIPFFFSYNNTRFYKCNSNESDFNALTELGATPISEQEYLKYHIVPSFIDYAQGIGQDRDQARKLIMYLYEHPDAFNEEWNKIKKIKFVPSEMNLQGHYEFQKPTSGLESFKSLCFHRYKNVCWTQCPIFDNSIEFNNSFYERYPTIGIPSPIDIIKHWLFIVEKIQSEHLFESTFIKNVIEEIYKIMNEFLQKEDLKEMIESEIKDLREKIFLNGDNPLDKGNWVAGKELVIVEFETQDVGEGMHKVEECLIPYKNLLLCAGAYEMITDETDDDENFENSEDDENVKINQKDVLINDLLKKLNEQSDEHHDVSFTFDDGQTICANRYVLSGLLI
jgi:hypothetical protein